MNRAAPRILFAASECSPWIKTGGLGDVAEALPAALVRLGLDVQVLLPGYRQVLSEARGAVTLGRLGPSAELPAARILGRRLPSGLPALIVDAPGLFDREGGPYQDADGTDWPDNALRFGMFGHAAARIAAGDGAPGWRADLVHLNDWQTGLAAAYLHYSGASEAGLQGAGLQRPRVLFTIHNLAFQGIFPPETAERVGLPQEAWSMQGVEFHGRLSFMKAGLQFADAITTVSPTYAAEIRRAPLGCGLDELLEHRARSLHGIVNGIDETIWNPATDPHIAARYDRDRLEAKAGNKAALQVRLGLAVEPQVPLFGFVGRLVWQKGIDLVIEAAPRLAALPAQLAVLGSGDRAIEASLAELAARLPGKMAITNGFDEALAHMIEAGSDAFLMPSRYEPCGLNQMYSQRYGTPPVAHATGGLRDTIVDCTPETLQSGTASGFLFTDATPDALFGAVTRACATWRDPSTWRELQRNGMGRDFGWDSSARRYVELYNSLLAERSRAPVARD